MAEIEDNIIGKEQTDDNIMFGAGGNDWVTAQCPRTESMSC